MTTTIVTKGIETRKVSTNNKGYCRYENITMDDIKKDDNKTKRSILNYSLATPFTKEQPHSRMMLDRDMAYYYVGLQRPYVSISEHDINVIVSALKVGDNIVNNYFDGIDNGDDELTDKKSQDAFLMGRTDLAGAADKYQWYTERGLALETLDSEDIIELMNDNIHELEEKEINWRQRLVSEYGDKYEYKNSKGLQKLIDRINDEELKVEDLEINLDIKTNSIPEEEQGAPNIYSMLELYIDRFNLSQLALLIDVIEDMYNKEEISFFYYLQCGIVVSSRLAYNTNKKAGWWELCDQLRKAKKNIFQTVACPTFEDRIYGKCSLNAEMAVDAIIDAKRISQRNTDPEKGIYLSEQEVIATWDTEEDELCGCAGVWETMLAQAGC